MKVKAKCWVKTNGEWHRPGDVFEATEVDERIMEACNEPDAEPTTDTDEPVRRGRKRKTEE